MNNSLIAQTQPTSDQNLWENRVRAVKAAVDAGKLPQEALDYIVQMDPRIPQQQLSMSNTGADQGFIDSFAQLRAKYADWEARQQAATQAEADKVLADSVWERYGNLPRNADGMVDPTSQEFRQLNQEMSTLLGSGFAGSLIGLRGARNLGGDYFRNFSKGALELRRGADPRKVYKDYGVGEIPTVPETNFVQPPPQPFMEISDVGASIRAPSDVRFAQNVLGIQESFTHLPTEQKYQLLQAQEIADKAAGYEMTVGDVLKHDLLYRAYPELRDTALNVHGESVNKIMTGANATFDPASGVGVNPNIAHLPDTLRPSMLHEVGGHATSEIEGLPSGSTPKVASQLLYHQLIKQMGALMRKAKAEGSAVISNDGTFIKTTNPALQAEYDTIVKHSLKNVADPSYAYATVLGEALARAVARRSKLTQAELQDNYILDQDSRMGLNTGSEQLWIAPRPGWTP